MIYTKHIFRRGGGIVRGTVRTGEHLSRRILADSFGAVQRVSPLRQAPKPGIDDVTLTRKVETEIFRGNGAPTATVNVNVVDGVVWLRGEVEWAEQIRGLERKATTVPEVRGVENLLRVPQAGLRAQ